jgi:Ca2+-binding RTX toxin-like protein
MPPPTAPKWLATDSQGGNDTITVAPGMTVPAFLFGGDGKDTIQGGDGPTVAVGRGGKDTIQGGAGPSILIGGEGRAQVKAGKGAAILIGGTTKFDANIEALEALHAEWARTDLTGSPEAVYLQKVADLTAGGTGAKNGPYPLNSTTVHANHASDTLRGGPALDLFFAHFGKHHADKLEGVQAGEDVFAI